MADVDLHFGVAMGGSDGDSEKTIRAQLNSIINSINAKPYEIKIKADDSSLREFRRSLTSLTTHAIKEAGRIRDVYSSALSGEAINRGDITGGTKSGSSRSADSQRKAAKVNADFYEYATRVIDDYYIAQKKVAEANKSVRNISSELTGTYSTYTAMSDEFNDIAQEATDAAIALDSLNFAMKDWSANDRNAAEKYLASKREEFRTWSSGLTGSKPDEKIYSLKEAQNIVKNYGKLVSEITKSEADIEWSTTYDKYISKSGKFAEHANELNKREAKFSDVIDKMDLMPLEDRAELQATLADETIRYNLALEKQSGKERSAFSYSDSVRAVNEYYAALKKLEKMSDKSDIVFGDSWIGGTDNLEKRVNALEYISQSGHNEALANELNQTKTAYDAVVAAKENLTSSQQAKIQDLITKRQREYNLVIEDQAKKERIAAEALETKQEKEKAKLDAANNKKAYDESLDAAKEYYKYLTYLKTTENDIFMDDGGKYKSASGKYDGLAETLNRVTKAFNEANVAAEKLPESLQDDFISENIRLKEEADIAAEKYAAKQEKENVILAKGSGEQLDAFIEIQKKRLEVEKLLDKYSASEHGDSSGAYKDLSDLTALGGLFDSLREKVETGTLSLEDYKLELLDIDRVISESSNTIKTAGEDHKWIDKGSDNYRDELEKIRKAEDKVNKYLDEYSAAGMDGAKTKAQYEGLQQLASGFRDLRQELEKGIDSEDYKKRLSKMVDDADNFARGIKAAGEDNKILTDGSKEQLDAIDKVNKALKTAKDNQKAWDAASENDNTKDAYADIDKQVTALNKLKEALDSGKLSAKQFADQYDVIERGLNKDYFKIQSEGMDLSKEQELERYQKALSEINAQIEKNESNLREWSSSKFQMPDAYKDLEKITNELKELQSELIRTGKVSEDFKNKFTNNVSKTEEVSGKIKLGGADHKSFGDSVVDVVKEMADTIDVMDVVYRTWEIGRNMVEAVTEIDTAMTELRKVTDETDASYNAFLKEASVRAKDLGATVTDVVSSSADFARLGYDLDGASSLADAAIVYKNVGDGISDIETASSSIISTMQAFGIEAKDAMSIVDSFNAIGNRFAISSGGVGDALLNSAASLHAAGNDIHESVALIAAASNIGSLCSNT